MSVVCKYLTAPAEAYSGPSPDRMTAVATPERSLCAWGHYHPASADKLADIPPWLQGLALAGHMVRPERDCPICPAFERGDPVETAHERP